MPESTEEPMEMMPSYSYQTHHGTFRIALRRGRWRVLFENDELGRYGSPH